MRQPHELELALRIVARSQVLVRQHEELQLGGTRIGGKRELELQRNASVSRAGAVPPLPIEFRAGAGAMKNSNRGERELEGNANWNCRGMQVCLELEMFRQHHDLELPIKFRAGAGAMKNSNRGETRIGIAEERSV